MFSGNIERPVEWNGLIDIEIIDFRSSHWKCSVEKGVLKNVTKFTGKYLCQNLFFNKVTDLRAATFLKKRIWHRCFLVNFVKFFACNFIKKEILIQVLSCEFLRTLLSQNTSGRQLPQFIPQSQKNLQFFDWQNERATQTVESLN